MIEEYCPHCQKLTLMNRVREPKKKTPDGKNSMEIRYISYSCQICGRFVRSEQVPDSELTGEKQLFVKQFLTGGDRNFGYLIADPESGKAIVIDPSNNPDMIVEFANQNHFNIEYIFNTHRHSDHTNGNEKIKALTGITAVAHNDREKATGQQIVDETLFELGPFNIKIIYTPGHTSDSICILIGDALFTGDTLFVGKVGGTDLGEQARDEYHSLHEKLMKLPDNTRVFPGHNYGIKPQSTIKLEKETNPFLLQPDFDSFVDLKRNWAEYKKKHGIA